MFYCQNHYCFHTVSLHPIHTISSHHSTRSMSKSYTQASSASNWTDTTTLQAYHQGQRTLSLPQRLWLWLIQILQVQLPIPFSTTIHCKNHYATIHYGWSQVHQNEGVPHAHCWENHPDLTPGLVPRMQMLPQTWWKDSRRGCQFCCQRNDGAVSDPMVPSIPSSDWHTHTWPVSGWTCWPHAGP